MNAVRNISVVLRAKCLVVPTVACSFRIDSMDTGVKVRWAFDTVTTRDSKVSVLMYCTKCLKIRKGEDCVNVKHIAGY